MLQTDYDAECHQQRMQTWPPRINRNHYAPHMPQHPQVLIWREVNGVDRFVVEADHAD